MSFCLTVLSILPLFLHLPFQMVFVLLSSRKVSYSSHSFPEFRSIILMLIKRKLDPQILRMYLQCIFYKSLNILNYNITMCQLLKSLINFSLSVVRFSYLCLLYSSLSAGFDLNPCSIKQFIKFLNMFERF